MGIINCHCESDTLGERTSETYHYQEQHTHKLLKNKVKSILSPRLHSLEAVDMMDGREEKNHYCVVRLSTESESFVVEVHGDGEKWIGTGGEGLEPKGEFSMALAYREGKLFGRDGGVGLGVWKWEHEVKVKMDYELLDIQGQFLIVHHHHKQPSTYQHITPHQQQTRTFHTPVRILHCHLIPTPNQITVKAASGLFRHLNQPTLLQENNLIRCGQNNYHISEITHYLQSSRLINKY